MTEQQSRFEFEERDGRRLKLVAGQAGKYVGVTERKGKFKTSFYARACVTKRKGDKRRQYAINGVDRGRYIWIAEWVHLLGGTWSGTSDGSLSRFSLQPSPLLQDDEI